MSNTLDPCIRRMRDAGSDAERALVLLEAPVFTLVRWRGEFARLCRRAAFDEGPDYIDALAETLRQDRRLGFANTNPADALRIRLVWIAEGGAAKSEVLEP